MGHTYFFTFIERNKESEDFMKKLLSTLLAVLLAVTMLTGMAIPAQAAENDIFNPGVLELDGSRTFTISKTKSSAFFSFTPETTGCYEFRIQNRKLKDVDVDFGIMDNYVMMLTSAGEVDAARYRGVSDTLATAMTLQAGERYLIYFIAYNQEQWERPVDFNVNVVSNFSWGYYFLCEEPDQSAVLSYFSSKEGTTECLHATKIGDYALGKQPKAIIDHFGNISSLNDYFYSFNIITSQGDNPVIMTNNGAFMPSGLINDQSFIYEGDTFNPTDAVYMLTDAVYYVSNGKIYSYNSGLLYRAAKHDKEYYWSNPASAYTYVYVFDELSKKFYILKKEVT